MSKINLVGCLEGIFVGSMIGNYLAGPPPQQQGPPTGIKFRDMPKAELAKWYSLGYRSDELGNEYAARVTEKFYDTEQVIPGGRPPAQDQMSDAYILAWYDAGFRWTDADDKNYVEYLLRERTPRPPRNYGRNGAVL
jgi:hypothetical protein